MSFLKIFIRLARLVIAVLLLSSCFYAIVDFFRDDFTIDYSVQENKEWIIKFDKLDLSFVLNDSTFMLKVQV